MRYINKAFQHIRLFATYFLLACTTLTALVCWRCARLLEAAAAKVYVLEDGKVLEALASERGENLPVEARDHVKTFHQDFFTLDPDDKVILRNIGRALYLADGSAREEYDREQEQNYYRDIVSGNVSQSVEVDSVRVDMSAYPYYFRCWATLTITRPSKIILRALVTDGYLRSVSRSDNDPHGFLIERWQILDSRDIKTSARWINP